MLENNVKLKVYQNYFNSLVGKCLSTGQPSDKLVDNAWAFAIANHPDETDEDTLRDYCIESLETL